eukprot:1158748-Pelagomonas_calceolata.AAC.3
MRVAGVLHIFQFETRQGEDICMALQTHINDIMMKRYSKECSTSIECLGPVPANKQYTRVRLALHLIYKGCSGAGVLQGAPALAGLAVLVSTCMYALPLVCVCT